MLTPDQPSGQLACPPTDVRDIRTSYVIVEGPHRRATEWRRAHRQGGCPRNVFYAFTDPQRESAPTMAVRYECGTALEGEWPVILAKSEEDKRNTPYYLEPFEQHQADIWMRLHGRACDVRLFSCDFCLHVRPGQQAIKRVSCGCGQAIIVAGREPAS